MMILECPHFNGKEKRTAVIFEKGLGELVCSFRRNCTNEDCLFSRNSKTEEK